MSRSPWCSPVGKRLRAMEDSDSSSDGEAYMYLRCLGDEVTTRSMMGEHDSDRDALGEVNMDADEEEDEENGEDDPPTDEENEEEDPPTDEDYVEDGIGVVIDRELRDQRHRFHHHQLDVVEEDDDSSDSIESFESFYSNPPHPDHSYRNPDDSGDDSDLIGGYGSSADEDEIDRCLPEQYLKHDPTPDTQYPKPNWMTLKGLSQRKFGCTSTRNLFEREVCNSLWMIQRLQKTKTLEEHTGCVNCNDFSSTGKLLCSAGDDLTVCIWDWQTGELKKKISTGHTNNIFHSQFCESDSKIITSSRDGTVRLIDTETSLSELLTSQSGEIGRLSFITPQTLVTCGTNAYVNHIDLRDKTSSFKLFIVRTPKDNRTCALHSINTHPIDRHKVVVAGASPYVFLYDLRRVVQNLNDYEHKPTYCLDRFEDTDNIVTSTAFNSNGDKLLISFNDDDLILCKTDTCEKIHNYTGHRNKRTIKGCAWFGDNYVLSGSDDGHIYGWDVESEHIVCFLKGDNKGAVNSLSVHPTLPILASSGREHNVKMWEPTSNIWPQTLKGIKPQICKNHMRRKRARERRSDYNGRFLSHGDESDTDW